MEVVEMNATRRMTRWIQRWHGGTLVLLWAIALPPVALAWMQEQQIRQANTVISFLRNASDVARALRDSAGGDSILRLMPRPDPVAIQRALLETRIHRLAFTMGLMLVMYGALFAATWSWFRGRRKRKRPGS
jgi:hypothetical protein